MRFRNTQDYAPLEALVTRMSRPWSARDMARLAFIARSRGLKGLKRRAISSRSLSRFSQGSHLRHRFGNSRLLCERHRSIEAPRHTDPDQRRLDCGARPAEWPQGIHKRYALRLHSGIVSVRLARMNHLFDRLPERLFSPLASAMSARSMTAVLSSILRGSLRPRWCRCWNGSMRPFRRVALFCIGATETWADCVSSRRPKRRMPRMAFNVT